MKPTWWLLYAIGLSLVGLLALVEIFVPRGGVQSILEITVVIGSFGLMVLTTAHSLRHGQRDRSTYRGHPDACHLQFCEKGALPTEAKVLLIDAATHAHQGHPNGGSLRWHRAPDGTWIERRPEQHLHAVGSYWSGGKVPAASVAWVALAEVTAADG